MCSKQYTQDKKLIIGYTTRRHLLLDLDNCDQIKAVGVAKQVMKQWNKVGDCLIVFSSKGTHTQELRKVRNKRTWYTWINDNYHLIFDNGIGYNLCTKICETLCRLEVLEYGYIKIRRFRGDMTLRISPSHLTDGVKPIPKPVGYIKNELTKRHDGYIFDYLRALRIATKMFSPYLPLQEFLSLPLYIDQIKY